MSGSEREPLVRFSAGAPDNSGGAGSGGAGYYQSGDSKYPLPSAQSGAGSDVSGGGHELPAPLTVPAGEEYDPEVNYALRRSITHYRIRKSSAHIWTAYTIASTIALILAVVYYLAVARIDRHREEPPAPPQPSAMALIPFYPSRHVGRFLVLTDLHVEPNFDPFNQDQALHICRSWPGSDVAGLAPSIVTAAAASASVADAEPTAASFPSVASYLSAADGLAGAVTGVCPAPAWDGGPGVSEDGTDPRAALPGEVASRFRFGRYNCDSPLYLLRSALQAMRATSQAIARDSGQTVPNGADDASDDAPTNSEGDGDNEDGDAANGIDVHVPLPNSALPAASQAASAPAAPKRRRHLTAQQKHQIKRDRKAAQKKLQQRRRRNAAAAAAARDEPAVGGVTSSSSSVSHDGVDSGDEIPIDIPPPIELPPDAPGDDSGADFVLIPGDFVAHGMACANSTFATMERAFREVASAFPNAAVLLALGNNDVWPDNYLRTPFRAAYPLPPLTSNVVRAPCDPQLRVVADLMFRFGWLSVDNRETFCRGGFYSRTIAPRAPAHSADDDDDADDQTDTPVRTRRGANAMTDPPNAPPVGPKVWPTGLRLRMIVLNTVVWAVGLKAKPTLGLERVPSSTSLACSGRERDPYGQFAWLEHELLSAEKRAERVYVVGHIPPGNKAAAGANLCPAYTAALTALVNRFRDTIVAQFYGDHSTDEFRLIWSDTAGPAAPSATATVTAAATAANAAAAPPAASAVSRVFVNPGLSPRKHCNPAFRVFWYDRRDAAPVDYANFALNLAQQIVAPTTPAPDDAAADGAVASAEVGLDAAQWALQYSFRAEFDADDLSVASLERVFDRLQTNATLLRRYARHFHVDTNAEFDLPEFWCDIRYTEQTSNAQCRRTALLRTTTR